ncbi:tRNA U34 5-methylaminomethyl-2-thiouridine-forming methyltransferase MnmC [Rhodovulum imhoffii]|uniref:tRNA U34 5-methylaminomethyl-2-thiouridine-forming methyltransferase MnmC n=1 Tax=Rhodovulum imhoffii TaxID=365340 RepID=A0A2T5BU73_9RHOB|nr:tRNA (5-methylaminomethyl-2-thiouridine)(34)-methyltransferase MnmD [Rhodovulum imhoffii]MBK5934559.1 FAD-dependent oxidoreductase [Rhodovulum imhoffii]PTN03024.1 tRNA U34 5-methylaminomethyl-2-thiouridine-forming methyltransferase MnmC [Rhodovulum imhoffii]
MHDHQSPILWQDNGVPVSARFDDPYFSLTDGLAETRHVFLAGNGLPGRFRAGFHIAELGFGTGLNLLAALIAWRTAGAPGRLRFTSFEAYPMPPEDMARALAAFPEASAAAAPLLSAWRAGGRRVDTADLSAEIIIGDARKTLPHWQGRADAWFLDGFSPARNPELWEPGLMAEVARHTAPGGTAATYTAAGAVRRGLAGAGFEVTRLPGFGRKRHMTAAQAPK